MFRLAGAMTQHYDIVHRPALQPTDQVHVQLSATSRATVPVRIVCEAAEAVLPEITTVSRTDRDILNVWV